MPTQSSNLPAWTATDLAADPHAAADKPERVRHMFESIAPRYDLNNRIHSFGQDRRWRAKAVGLSRLAPGDRVLDVACGTGDLSEAFAAAGAAEVVGADFTPGMLERARERAATLAPERRPRYELADATDLPFADATFDVVSIAFGIRNVGDPPKALREFHRVLRPGGRVVILEFSTPRNRLVRAANALYCQRIMPLTAALIARDRVGAYRYLPRSVATFPDHERFATMVRDAGFADVTQTPLTWGVCAVTVGHR